MTVLNNSKQMFSGSNQVMGLYRGPNFLWGPFNKATGGTEATITNYNGTGQVWKTHTFSSNGSLNVTFAPGALPFRVHVGAGNRGGHSSGCCGSCASNGSFGQNQVNDNATISLGSHAVTVGAGGAGGPWSAPTGNAGSWGGSSSLAGVMSSNGAGAYSTVASNITGTQQNLGFQTWWGNCGDGNNGQPGIKGRVIVAYRVG